MACDIEARSCIEFPIFSNTIRLALFLTVLVFHCFVMLRLYNNLEVADGYLRSSMR